MAELPAYQAIKDHILARIDIARERRHVGEVALQPMPARRVRARLPRHRVNPPAGIAHAIQQRQADLPAGTEHQRGFHALAVFGSTMRNQTSPSNAAMTEAINTPITLSV